MGIFYAAFLVEASNTTTTQISSKHVAPGATARAYFAAMKYRRFGRTELAMPVLSCGGMRYQFKWQDVKPNEIPPENQANLEATIQRAFELGINHIETARGYGSSEMQLGNILPRLPRDKIIVQTKIGPREDPRDFLRHSRPLSKICALIMWTCLPCTA